MEATPFGRTRVPPRLAERCPCRRIARSPCLALLCLASFYGAPRPVSGAGLALMEQGVRELGQAFAGAASSFEDGSSVYFNAGALGRFERPMLSVAGYVMLPGTRFHDGGSHMSPSLGGAPLAGSDGGDAGVTALLPNAYLVQPIAPGLVFGLGVNAPFGSHNAYQEGWKGRYQNLSSDLKTININPSLAIRIRDDLAFGAGINIQYLQASLTSAIDFGTACFATFGPLACSAQRLLPQQSDGKLTLEGNSLALGYNLGIHYTPLQGTALGVSYRSRVEHRVDGHVDFDVPGEAAAMTAGGRFTDTDTQSTVVMPDSLEFGFTQQIGRQWSLSAEALWTHWSLSRELRTRLDSPAGDLVETLDWQDTWRWALGTSFKPEERWTLRAGLAFDQSPVRSGRLRTARIPDSDRVWLTIGLSYQLGADLTLHGAYAHVFFAEASINHTGSTGDQLIGRYQQQADIIGLQLDWRY